MKKLLAQTAIAGALMMTASAASAACVDIGSFSYVGCTLSEFATAYVPANFSTFTSTFTNVSGSWYTDASSFGDWYGILYKGPTVASSIVAGLEDNFATGTVSGATISVPFEGAGVGLPALAVLGGYLAWRRNRTVATA